MKPQTRPLKLIVKKALILIALIAGMCHLFGPTAHANGLIPAEIWLTFDYKTAQPARLEGILYTGKDKTRTGMIVLAILIVAGNIRLHDLCAVCNLFRPL